MMAGPNQPATMLHRITQDVMFRCSLLVVVFQLSYVNSSSEILRPRGVAISKASLYDPLKDFTCFDGLRSIPFKYVNDDYCDCEDGSDEPGTSACPVGFFHCTNAGHRPLNIPSSRVNDGICDCCDGTDEYASSAKCENTCTELGKSARAAAQRMAELTKQGNELRLQLIRQGKNLKGEKQTRMEQLMKDKEEANRLKEEKEALKKAAEELENSALEKYVKAEEEKRSQKQAEENIDEEKEAFEQFQRLDSDHDGFIRIADLQSRQTFDKDRNGEVSEEEARFFLDGDELDWSNFFSHAWPRMKPYLMMEKGLFTPPTAPSINLPAENAEPFPTEDVDDEEEPEGDEEPPADNTNIDGEGEVEELKDDQQDEPQYDENTQQLIEDARKARSEYEDAERSLRDVEREINDIEEGLNKDFGAEEEFATLQGQCFEFTDREYTYRMCPFDQVSQIPRSGGADTRLGSWGRWSGHPDKYSTMLFDHGQSCWNGPQRTATVNVVCGLDNALTSASEPNRCEYLFEFATPAACHIESSSNTHDEL